MASVAREPGFHFDQRRASALSGKLIVIRGNAASGKTSVARGLVSSATWPMVHVPQDTIRRDILPRSQASPPDQQALIRHITDWALGRDYDVVLEGILNARTHRALLQSLYARWPTSVFYLDIPFDESLRRAKTRSWFCAQHMRDWYLPHDTLGLDTEIVFGPRLSVQEMVTCVRSVAGL